MIGKQNFLHLNNSINGQLQDMLQQLILYVPDFSIIILLAHIVGSPTNIAADSTPLVKNEVTLPFVD